MANSFFDRLSKAWNVFTARDDRDYTRRTMTNDFYDYVTSYRTDRVRIRAGNERTIIASIYSQIANDVASVTFEHARVDQNGRFIDMIDSNLNKCLTLSANIDQTHREFMMDVVLSMFDEGHAVIVPVDVDVDINSTSTLDILSMRVGRVTQWMPRSVRVEVYNDHNGKREEVTLPKDKVAIIENPFYSVMNEPNSTAKRLMHKLALMDSLDDKAASPRLDLIIQLPYTIRSESRQAQADKRLKEIETQLAGSTYGIAYIDGTEHVTQLNRSVDNNLMTQIQYLTDSLYSQLGVPKAVFDGTADEATMLNYHNRTIEPIVSAIVNEMKRKFLTQTARTQGQTIMSFQDPFRLVPVSQLAELVDKFSRNEILSGNEIRAIIGYKPVADERADMLVNKNLNQSPEDLAARQIGFVDGSQPGNEANSVGVMDVRVSDLGDA